MRFRDRTEAGGQLARELVRRHPADPVVLALPRGGVPVAYPVAVALGGPLEVFVARKIGAPDQPEFGVGAIAEGDSIVLNQDALGSLEIPPQVWTRLVHQERTELARAVERYRGHRALPPLDGRDVIVVDDGLATGVTAEAALLALRNRRPRRLILAAPVGAPTTVQRLAEAADEVVCLACPEEFTAVGHWYEVFDQTTDEQVLALLGRTRIPSARRAI